LGRAFRPLHQVADRNYQQSEYWQGTLARLKVNCRLVGERAGRALLDQPASLKKGPKGRRASLSELGNIDFPWRTTKRGKQPLVQFVLHAARQYPHHGGLYLRLAPIPV